MAILTKPKNNNLSLRDRMSRLEGKMSILIPLQVGTFLTVVGYVLAQAVG